MRIAVLGLGEAGMAFATDLVASGADVRAFDPRVQAPTGVAARTSDADAVRDADVVLSVVTAHESIGAVDAALDSLRPQTIWADLNTSSPGMKQEIARRIDGRCRVLDVAIMAPVPGRGLATPWDAAGPDSQEFADSFNPLGAKVSVIDGPVGTAASRKLLRSVFFKGLSAAVVEALEGARAAGQEDWLRANVAGELAGFDEHTIDRLVQGSILHAVRRADEMDAAAQQLIELGVQPRVASAARDQLQALSTE